MTTEYGDLATLPHDDYAERGLLGSVLRDGARFEQARAMIRSADLYRPSHRVLFDGFNALASQGHPIHLVTVNNWLHENDKIEAVGGSGYVATLHGDTPEGADIQWFADRIRAKSAERDILTNFKYLSDALLNGHSSEDRSRAVNDYRGLLEANLDVIQGVKRDIVFELASVVLGRPIPKVPPIIDGILWPGDIGLLSGAGGVGKTWLLQDLSIALASGRDAFGHLKVAAPVRVGFLDLESRAWEIDQRVNRMAGAAGLAGLLLIRERIRLDRPDDVRRIRALIERERLRFFAVDSLRRSIAGDINKAEVINALFVDVLDPIRTETGCGFLISAHTRKRTGDTDLDSADQAMSGTVDLRNMSDFHAGVEERDGNLCIVPTKTRHGQLPEPFLVSLDGLSGDDDEPVTVHYVGAVDKASDAAQDSVFTLLSDAASAGLLRGELIGRSRYSEKGVDNALRGLKKRGRVTSKREGKQRRYFIVESERPHDRKTAASGETES